MRIKVRTKNTEFTVVLNDSKTASEIYVNLPFISDVQTWGNEIYFEIPLKLKSEDPTTILKVGDVAYWEQGTCFCIFFGKTPMSSGVFPVPASPVSIFGHIECEIDILEQIKDGDKIEVVRE